MKILWAVDISENHPKAVQAMSRFLTALNKRSSIVVDAVSMVYPVDESQSESVKKESLRALEKRIGRSSKLAWFNDFHVVVEGQSLQRGAVLSLIEFAKKGKYDGIAVVKHSKENRKRAYLGSFAEMLCFLSPLPLFVVNPDGVLPKVVDKMFIATDANPDSAKEFKKLSQFLNLEKAKIHLHHAISVIFPGRMTAEEQESYRISEEKNAQEGLAEVLETASRLGSKAVMSIVQQNLSKEDSILKAAFKSKSDLIVVTHKGVGAFGFFLGKITRRIIQNADRPVLLFRA